MRMLFAFPDNLELTFEIPREVEEIELGLDG